MANLKKKQVTQKELKTIAKKKCSVRAGSTNSIPERLDKYKKKYEGTMYYSSTSNKEKAENTLFNIKKFQDNVHKESNVDNEPGFVYIIEKNNCKTKK